MVLIYYTYDSDRYKSWMDRRMRPAFFCGQVKASELAVRLDETRTEVELDHDKGHRKIVEYHGASQP